MTDDTTQVEEQITTQEERVAPQATRISLQDEQLTPQEQKLLSMDLANLEELRRIVDRMVSRKRAIIRERELAEERERLEAERDARLAEAATNPPAERIVRYRDPENPENTWTGHGRRPNWLRERLEEDGATLADFAV